jgi:hypothetical protein
VTKPIAWLALALLVFSGAAEVSPIDRPLFERFTAGSRGGRQRQLGELRVDPAALEQAFAAAAFYERVSRFFAGEGVRAVMAPTGNNPRRA